MAPVPRWTTPRWVWPPLLPPPLDVRAGHQMADDSGPNYRTVSFHTGRDIEAGRTGRPRGEELNLDEYCGGGEAAYNSWIILEKAAPVQEEGGS